MIYDGVLERFPQLRIGIIELHKLGTRVIDEFRYGCFLALSLIKAEKLVVEAFRVFSASDSGGTSAYRKYWMDFT